jgi:nucleoside-diphosphate-sugar epimerase
MSKKVLVLGATGAMGQYLAPRLAEMGYLVDGVSLDAAISTHKNLKYIQANTKAEGVLDSLLANNYDCIVDFMIYDRDTFADWAPKLLGATDHYIYLSSYRVYANEEVPIKETSPLLNDVLSEEEKRLGHNDYCLYKARGEKIVRAWEKKNWTIIRPAITYSFGRYQLTTLEAGVVINRVRAGKTLLLPDIYKQWPPSIKPPDGVAGVALYQNVFHNTAGLMIIFPLVIVYLFCQRYLVQGIERSGLVG